MKKIGKTVAIERNERDEKEPFKGMERERAKRLVCIQGIERAEATTHSQSQFSTNQIKRGISPT